MTLFCAEGSEVPGVQIFTVAAPPDASDALVMPGGRPPPAAPGVARAITQMFEAIKARNFDVISQHAFDAPAFDRGRGLPILHTLHLPPLVPAVVEAASRVEASRLAAVSASCQAGWLEAGVKVERVVANGVEEMRDAGTPVERIALVAGRISPEKGIEHALAAAQAAGLPVQVAGALYDPEYGLDLGQADYVGPLPRARLRELMAHAAVTVCAVRWEEPFGMVAAEAQMAGCPVAAYRRGALPEVVEDGVSGALADPDDIASLAGAINRCLTLDRAGVQESARRRLSLEPALDRYESALRQAAR